MKPLTTLEIRDLNAEIEDYLKHLKPMSSFGIVHAFKGRSLKDALKRKTVYGLGYTIEDIMTYLCTRFWNCLIHEYTGSNYDASFNFKNISGVDKPLTIYHTTAGYGTFQLCGSRAYGTQLGFGNPATTPTPTRDDYELAQVVARFNPSSRQYSEATMRTILTGSWVWAAGGTIREIGQYVNWYSSAVVEVFLMYHDAVADTVCPAGGTVAVTYITQY